mmetsp:Transcript_132708/g.314555  ORF Transcript_132708/g.314555 Transcript_132708/m.314555 type:complete len:224 (-) Transcript_132708:1078-1749(-)
MTSLDPLGLALVSASTSASGSTFSGSVATATGGTGAVSTGAGSADAGPAAVWLFTKSSSASVHGKSASSLHPALGLPFSSSWQTSLATCCCISSTVAEASLDPVSFIHSSGVCGLVVPNSCGYGHSRGKAWCIHWAKSRPWMGTLPPFASATCCRRFCRPWLSTRGALTVSDDMLATSRTICWDSAIDVFSSPSRLPMRSSHSLRQQIAYRPEASKQFGRAIM